MFESCLKKQNHVKTLFADCQSDDQRYQKIIQLGRNLPKLDDSEKIPANLVSGCQSLMYLTSRLEDNRVIFAAESDALISSGLADILMQVYSGETPEVILKCPPSYLEDLGLDSSLSLLRANGLYSIHLRMKQDALKLLLKGQRD